MQISCFLIEGRSCATRNTSTAGGGAVRSSSELTLDGVQCATPRQQAAEGPPPGPGAHPPGADDVCGAPDLPDTAGPPAPGGPVHRTQEGEGLNVG